MSIWLFVTVITSLALYGFAYVATTLWITNRSRKGRLPFGQNEKLLRRPGQYLEEQIDRLDERLPKVALLGVALPPLIFCVLMLGVPWIPQESRLLVLVLILAVFLVSLVVRVRRLRDLILNRRDLQVGLMGERYVADTLQPLTQKGYVLFHDVPAEGRGGTFNLDHVVVGPSGVFVVETKTRRKGRKKGLENDHRLSFDGERITWPEGVVDDAPISQVRAAAGWLRQWLTKRLVVDEVPVKAFVTFPGWWVDARGRGEVNVWNPKQLPSAIEGKSILSKHQIRQIAAQLDSLCRTVDIPNTKN